MSDSNGTAAEPQTVSVEEYNKVVARAQRFEGQVVDYEKRYKPLGDPDDIKGKLTHYEELRAKDSGGDPKKIEEIVTAKTAEVEKRFSTALETEREEKQRLQSQLKSLKVTSVALEKLSSKVTADGLKLIKPVIESDCDLDGDQVVIKGTDGKPRYSKGNPQKLMDIDEYIDELEGAFPSVFVSSAVSGGRQAGTKVDPKAGKMYSLAELKLMPDGGKAAMAAMEKAQPGSVQRLFTRN